MFNSKALSFENVANTWIFSLSTVVGKPFSNSLNLLNVQFGWFSSFLFFFSFVFLKMHWPTPSGDKSVLYLLSLFFNV